MTCRDRLLAFLADSNWALDIREGGNLHRILQQQQTQQPRSLRISFPASESARSSANLELLASHPETEILPDPPPDRHRVHPAERDQQIQPSVFESISTMQIDRRDYLYHYTRSCPAPWPGQSYQEYLLSLLYNEPYCGHTALDTLVRILLEGRIRASLKLVRGELPVVSWTAAHPLQLEKLRQWNSALIRWTFEPYGLAIRKELVRKDGALPVIYVPESDFERLKPADRFRYQKHEPPKSSWKHEREWRLPHDFQLEGLSRKDAFIFVPEMDDARLISDHVQSPLPLLVLSADTAGT